MTRRELEALYGRLANHLSGRPVSLHFETPSGGWSGCAGCLAGKGAYIQVSPGLVDLESELAVLLHECGHIRRHYGLYSPAQAREVQTTPGGPSYQAREAHNGQTRELEANELRDAWLKFAQERAWKYENSQTPFFVARILALMDWTPNQTERKK